MKEMVFFMLIFGLQLLLSLAALKLIVILDWTYTLVADRFPLGILLFGCCMGAGYAVLVRSRPAAVLWPAYPVLAVYLTVCVITDLQTCRVYDFLQLPAVVAGAALCLLQSLPPESGVGLILFSLLQYLLFGRLYGVGDVMAFQICGLYIAGKGGNFQTLLLHMALAFAILGVVQFCRHNINKRGNLKEAVPFVPYIACSLLWFL